MKHAAGSKRQAVGRLVFCALLALRAVPSPATEASDSTLAATIRGRLVVQGPVPPSKKLPPGRDACCQAAAPVDESLLVSPVGGLANVIVTVEPRRGETKPPTSPPPAEPAILTNRGCSFTPRVVVARVGQSLELLNADPTMHNVQADFVRNPAVNLVVEPEGRRELALPKPERKPISVRCNVHTFMRAWVVVRDDPYAAVTGPDGQFELPALPKGSWRLRFWHEGQPLVSLAVGAVKTDQRGEIVLSLEEAIDLGDLTLSADQLR